MTQAASGNTVHVHYTGRLANGEQFDSSAGRDPLEFTLGEGQVIPGFDAAVTGLEEGESREVTIPCAEAYGPRRDELVAEVPREHLPADMEPQVGQQLQVQTGDGQPMVVRVTATADESITIDGNHPLAGEDLTFELELVKVA